MLLHDRIITFSGYKLYIPYLKLLISKVKDNNDSICKNELIHQLKNIIDFPNLISIIMEISINIHEISTDLKFFHDEHFDDEHTVIIFTALCYCLNDNIIKKGFFFNFKFFF
jgi:hypothetical protein